MVIPAIQVLRHLNSWLLTGFKCVSHPPLVRELRIIFGEILTRNKAEPASAMGWPGAAADFTCLPILPFRRNFETNQILHTFKSAVFPPKAGLTTADPVCSERFPSNQSYS